LRAIFISHVVVGILNMPSVCLSVCLPKLLNGFGRKFVQGQRSVQDNASRILVTIVPCVPPGCQNVVFL